MKKNGFTLIELLAVIVILAIIAVITVPKIADMISSSRKGGAEDSFYGTLKASELGYTKALQSKADLKGDTCDLSKTSGDKVTCTNGTVIAFTGKAPEKGIVSVSSNGALGLGISTNGYECSGEIGTKNPCIKTGPAYATDNLKQKIVANGEGLYIDEFSPGKATYRGNNPDNYLKIDEKLWRIVSVETDGTIKVISDLSVDKRMFDNLGVRKTENNTFCVSSDTVGCGIWAKSEKPFTDHITTGTVTEDSELSKYLNGEYYNTLSTTFKGIIAKHSFNYGPVHHTKAGVKAIINSEEKQVWTGNVGLISGSEFFNASTNPECRAASGNTAWNSKTICVGNNYLSVPKVHYWTITSEDVEREENGKMAGIVATTTGCFAWSPSNRVYDVYPVMYLKSSITLTGEGTKTNPFIVN